ncbi:ABC transporter permease [Leekyejoonella antrihumi]|uniref:Iron ABC transporter permease n=1 Tax=Leekyejoonella antrihumi TaxID=1660198 RepID=A0A563E965_9MICO|nr:iron ABC transporter permease [Leekyejoonella antrihumi]TWP39060.1 iron ABC transporter permease [Leekyejoonella antrihumi]
MPSRWPRRAALTALALIPLVFLAVFFVLPVGGMVLRGLHPDGSWALGDTWSVLSRPPERQALWFTLWIAVLGTALTTALGVPVAYVLYRLRLPGRRVLRGIVVTPFVLPTVVVGVAFRTLLVQSGPLGFLNIDASWVAILLALVFFNLAVVVRTVGAVWEGLDPRAEESAAALGASPWQVFRTVTLPALRPSIISAASVVFLFCATAFGVVLILGGTRYSTIETQIYLLTTNLLDLRSAAVLSIVQLLAVVVLLWGAEIARSRKQRTTVTAGRGGLRAVRFSDAIPLALTGLVVLFVVAPLATLVVRSLQIDGVWTLDNYRHLASDGADNALLVPVWQALDNSWRIAIDATAMAVVLGVIVSVLVTRRGSTRHTRGLLTALDGAFMLPLGISAVTVGFGFLITLNHPPLDLRSSPILIPIAQALVALPLVVRTLAPALRSTDERQRQAAAALGASPLRAMVTVDLPVVWRPLLAATGFALAVSLGEFGATSFLAQPDHPTLPVVIYALIGHPGAVNFGMALAGSVVLAGMTALVMGLVERLHVTSMGAF